MKVVAINGSPRGEASNSRLVISYLQERVSNCEWTVIPSIRNPSPDQGMLDLMLGADVLVLVFPLYVDSVPGSLMGFLESYANYRKNRSKNDLRPQRVFGFVNCGFIEGNQTAGALQVVQHFCADAGVSWVGGVGFGSGEMISALKNVPARVGIRKPLFAAVGALAEAIANPEGRLPENQFLQHRLPWWAFKFIAEFMWRKQAKKNGLRSRDLFAVPDIE
jgi:multimeric flavodoxin WrbA